MKKVDATTYSLGENFFVEKMADGTWTAYEAVDPNERWTAGNYWTSPKHSSRQGAWYAARARRRRKHAGA